MEYGVVRYKGEFEPDRGCCDPSVGLVDLLAEAVAGRLTPCAEVGAHCHQGVVGLHDHEAGQVTFEPAAA